MILPDATMKRKKPRGKTGFGKPKPTRNTPSIFDGEAICCTLSIGLLTPSLCIFIRLPHAALHSVGRSSVPSTLYEVYCAHSEAHGVGANPADTTALATRPHNGRGYSTRRTVRVAAAAVANVGAHLSAIAAKKKVPYCIGHRHAPLRVFAPSGKP
jgi:hypothetical protein